MYSLHLIADMLEQLLEQQLLLVREMERQHTCSGAHTDTRLLKLINSAELCKELNIALHTLYAYIRKFGIPVYRIGRKCYFRLGEVYTCMMKARKN